MSIRLFEQFARSVSAIQNCAAGGNVEWLHRHSERAELWCKDKMPSGGGFDNGTRLLISESTGERLVFETSFHHMDENGGYCGWSEHRVVVTASLQFGFSLRVTGRDQRNIKEYISDCFTQALDEITEA